MCIKQTVANNLKHYRKKAGLSQERMANIVECNKSTYQSYEEARAIPPIEKMLRIVEVLNLSSLYDLIYPFGDSKNTKVRNGNGQTLKDSLLKQYRSLPMDKRRIVDFILKN